MAPPRGFLGHTVQDRSGNALSSVSVTVYESDGTTLLGRAMYSASSGGSVKANPLTSDSNGFVFAYAALDEDFDGEVVVKANGVSYPSKFIPDQSTVMSAAGPDPWIDVRTYGAVFDGIMRLDGTVASGSPALTVPLGGAHTGFTSADVGKRVVVVEVSGSGNSAVETNRAVGTISQVVDATHVIMSANASATLSGTAKVVWGTDDSGAIQAAINAATTDGLTTQVRLPHGIAMIATGLVWNGYGGGIVGPDAALVDANDVNTGTLLVGCTAGMVVLTVAGNHLSFGGFAIDGAGRVATTGIGTYVDSGLHWSSFRQIRVAACVNGLYLDYEQISNAFHDCTFLRNTHGLRNDRTNGALAAQKVYFYNCSFEINVTTGAKLTSAEMYAFIGGAFQHSPVGLQVTGSTDIHASFCQFESNTIGIEFVKDSLSSSSQSVIASSIHGNWFTSCTTGIKATGARGVSIDGNHFVSATSCVNFTDSGVSNALNILNRYGHNSIVSCTAEIAASDGLTILSPSRLTAANKTFEVRSHDEISLMVINDKAYSNGDQRYAEVTFATNNPNADSSGKSARLVAEMTPATGVTLPASELVAYIATNADGSFEALRIKEDRLVLKEGPQIVFGSGSPEGVVTAPVGSIYLRSDGSTSTTLYVKTSGSGSSGWTAK